MKRVACALVLPLILAAGCAATQSPKTNFYMLSVEGEPAPSRGDAAGGAVVRVSVLRAAVPGVVDRPQIVARIAPNRVEIYDFHRWVEPLQEAIPRVVAGNLARQLGPRYTVVAGVMPGLPPDVRVSVDVQRFEAAMDGGVTIEALWSVRPTAGEALAGRAVIDERATEGGHTGIVAAYSRALAALARNIADGVASESVSRSTGSRP